MNRFSIALALSLAVAAPAFGQTTASTATAAAAESAVTAAPAAAINIDALAAKVRSSLVLVEWHYSDENVSREEVGQGIVIAKDTVLIWGGLISEAVPKDYIKGVKIRLPGKNFTTVKATFLGRTQNRLFAYVKADKPIDVPPLEISKTAEVKLGQHVAAVAILDKSGGYETYVGTSDIKAIQKRTVTLAGTAVFSLTRANSPVFDSATGAFIGLTAPSSGEDFLMRTPNGAARVELFDEQQSSSFLPYDEIKDFLTNIPTKPFDIARPWAGVGGLSGLEEAERDIKHIQQISGVAVGSIVPGEAAEKAGLQSRDIILTINGKPFSDSPVPEVMRAHFQREIEKHKAGDTLKLGIMREDKTLDIALTLGASPKVGSELPHIFESKVGIVTRDVNFWDLYNRKLPAETKGVMVALVKNGAPASLGSTPLKSGFIITKINDSAVENQKQFMDLVKKETDDPEKKELVFVVLLSDGENKVCRIDLTK